MIEHNETNRDWLLTIKEQALLNKLANNPRSSKEKIAKEYPNLKHDVMEGFMKDETKSNSDKKHVLENLRKLEDKLWVAWWWGLVLEWIWDIIEERSDTAASWIRDTLSQNEWKEKWKSDTFVLKNGTEVTYLTKYNEKTKTFTMVIDDWFWNIRYTWIHSNTPQIEEREIKKIFDKYEKRDFWPIDNFLWTTIKAWNEWIPTGWEKIEAWFKAMSGQTWKWIKEVGGNLYKGTKDIVSWIPNHMSKELSKSWESLYHKSWKVLWRVADITKEAATRSYQGMQIEKIDEFFINREKWEKAWWRFGEFTDKYWDKVNYRILKKGNTSEMVVDDNFWNTAIFGIPNEKTYTFLINEYKKLDLWVIKSLFWTRMKYSDIKDYQKKK